MPPDPSNTPVYRASAKNVRPLFLAILVVVVALVAMGFHGLDYMPPELGDPAMRFVCGYLPFILAVMLFVLPIMAVKGYAGARFTLRNEGLVYEKGPDMLVIKWRDLTLIRPNPHKKGPFLSAVVSDGKRFLRIDKFFYLQFEDMIEEIESRRLQARREHSV